MQLRILALLLALLGTFRLSAFDVAEALPLTERFILIHIVDGHVEHHGRGQPRAGEKAIITALDTAKSDQPATWGIKSADDSNFSEAKVPVKVARKSKGNDFAWLVEKWINNRAVNDSPDHATEHWVYLEVPSALKPGATYTINSNGLLPDSFALKFTYDLKKARSEAVHVNLIGYAPQAPEKFAYVYSWMGTAGSLDVKPLTGKTFSLINTETGEAVFTGKTAFRFSKDQPETGHVKVTPQGNYLGADVLECDFSKFDKPGKYVVSVEGVGCSFPFKVDADVYREPFITCVRGLYHNRSGIELKKPYTEFERPAPHNPKLTPGFAGKLVYTKSRNMDWSNGDASLKDKPAIEAGILGPIESCGWYQDAGDWDSYNSHLNVATYLLFAYEMRPENFKDNEQNIPESGNGVPDILDEAAWLPRFCCRLRAELIAKKFGTGGIGLRVCGDHFGGDGEGIGSWQDPRQWIVSGEEPPATFSYAGVAAHLAYCLKLAKVKDPEGTDWEKEAKESFAWAEANMRPGDEKKDVPHNRAYAASALFRLTGEAKYEEQFKKDIAWLKPGVDPEYHSRFGPWLYVLGGGEAKRDEETLKRLQSAILMHCDKIALGSSTKRALRWGGNWWFPMVIGQQTTPMILEAMVGYTLTQKTDPEKAKQFLGCAYTTCDYFLGTNSNNMTWVTGLGPRHPHFAMHLDAWYNGKPTEHPGIIPYGPAAKGKDLGMGPWDADWANPTYYPKVDEWPGNERYCDNRCAPMTGEFTIHQNTVLAAAAFGWLCAPAKK